VWRGFLVVRHPLPAPLFVQPSSSSFPAQRNFISVLAEVRLLVVTPTFAGIKIRQVAFATRVIRTVALSPSAAPPAASAGSPPDDLASAGKVPEGGVELGAEQRRQRLVVPLLSPESVAARRRCDLTLKRKDVISYYQLSVFWIRIQYKTGESAIIDPVLRIRILDPVLF
jgi:hypothetical protein